MRANERDTLLFILAITSGSSDAWSYLGLGHAFVANMTGNTVLLGIAVFGEHGDVMHPAIALASYAAGVAIGSFLTRKVKQNSLWSTSISVVLLIEGFLLLVSAAAWVWADAMPSLILRSSLLSCVAVAIGLQSGAMLSLKLPGVVTTYISGTWTTLVSGLVLLKSGRERIGGNQTSFEDRLLVQAVFLATYFTSAIAAGWAFRYAPMMVAVIATVPILIVASYGAIRGE